MPKTYDTTPNNFGEPKSETKYLDLAGLKVFLDKLKEYIYDSDKNLNGTNITLYGSGADNPSITSQIESLWEALGGDLGDGNTISGSISTILGQYVKDIINPVNQGTPLKVVVSEGTGDQKDIYTISLADNGLTELLKDLDDSKINSVTKGSSSETYVALGVSASDNVVTITISDAKLVEEINDIKDTYALKTEIPTHLSHSIKLKGTDDKEHAFNGSAEVDLTAGVNYAANSGKLGGQEPSYYAKQSDLNSTNERVGNIEGSYVKTVDVGTNGTYTQLTVTPENGDVKIIVNDSAIGGINERLGDVEDSYVKTFGNKNGDIAIRNNSTTPWDVNFEMDDNNTLKGTVEKPSHLGIEDISVSSSLDSIVTITESESDGVSTIAIGGTLKDDLDGIDERLGDINTALQNRIQDIDVENGNTGAKYVTISVTDDTNNVSTDGKQSKITINDSALTEAISDIRSTISGLGKVVEIKGIVSVLPTTTTGYGDGDVLIVGDKEYICFESKWYLFGYTSELAEDFNTHTHTYTPAGTIESDFEGTQSTITTGGASAVTDVSKLKTAGSVPTYSSVSASGPNHTHSGSYTPAGTIESGFDGTTATITTGGASAVTDVSKLKTAGSVPTYSGVSLPNTSHTHSVTHTPAGTVESDFEGTTATITTGGASAATEVSKLKTAGSVPTYSGVSVPNTLHTHSVTHTPAGTVTSTFDGTSATITTGGASAATEVSKLKTAGSVPTYLGIPVPNTLHTHSVTHTPAGTVTSTFAGKTDTITTGGASATTTVATAPTISYSDAVLTITFGTTTVASSAHTHSVSYTPAGSVTSTFAGTAATLTSTKPDINSVITVNSITDVGSMPTFDSVEVASSAHTHSASYTPAGTVTSTFKGTSATLTSTKPDTTNVSTVNSMTSAGSMPTFDSVEVASSTHTHSASYKPAGTVTSTFAGTSATLTSTKPDTTNVSTVNSMTSVGSMPTFDSVEVASSTHTHSASYKPAGTVTSTFAGTQGTINVSKSNDTVNVNSMTSAGSMPTFDSVEVASSTHTHSASYKPAGTVTSTFVGTQGNTSVPTDLHEAPDEIVE